MAIDRSVNSTSTNEVPASLEEFAAKAYSKDAERPILIADGSMDQLDKYKAEQAAQQAAAARQPERTAPPSQCHRDVPPVIYPQPVPQPDCLPPIYGPQYFHYQPGSMYCRRMYTPAQPRLPHPIDKRVLDRCQPNFLLVKPALDLLAQIDGLPILDKYPSEVSRQDPSACFLNLVLQQIIHRQTAGNTVQKIADNLDELQHPTMHFAHPPLKTEQPGDIIIAYPKDGSRPEAAVYLGNGNVASFNPETKRITTHDSMRYFYPQEDPKADPTKFFFGKTVLYRWESRNFGY